MSMKVNATNRFKVLVFTLSLLASSVVLGNDSKKELIPAGAFAEEFSDSFRIKLNFTKTGSQVSYESSEEDGEAIGESFDPIDIRRFISVYLNNKVMNVDFVTNGSQGVGVYVLGEFNPKSEYKVKVKEGLQSQSGFTLAKAFEKNVKIPDFKPRFRFLENSRYVPGKFQGSIGWEAMNAQEVKFQIRQIPPQNIHQWKSVEGQWYSDSEKFSDLVTEKKEKIQSNSNTKKSGTLSLEAISPLGQGVFEIRGQLLQKDETVEGAADVATIVVTNLVIVSKVTGTNKSTVWVKSITDLSPVRNAEVTAYSKTNKLLGKCTTGFFDGSCEIAWASSRPEPLDYLIAKTQSDLSYGKVSETELSNDKLHAGTRDYQESNSQFQAFAYSSRNLYRPGETLEFGAMIRDKAYKAIGKLPLKWTLINPKGQVIKNVISETSDQGMGYLNFQTALTSDTGQYELTLLAGDEEIGKTSVLVEEFVPERLSVNVKGKSDFIDLKGKAEFAINAQYLFGGPVSKGNYAVSCALSRAFDRVPGNTDFWTGAYAKQASKPTLLSVQEGQLNSDGMGKASCEVNPSTKKSMESVYAISAKVDVKESGSGRATSSASQILVGPTDNIFGLKLEKTTENTIQLKGASFDLKGKPTNHSGFVDLELILVRQNWYYGNRSDGDSGWDVEEVITPVNVKKSVQWMQGKFDVVIDVPDQWGQWLVRAKDRSSNYRADIMVGYLGYSWMAEGRTNNKHAPEPTQLKITTPEDVVAPNQMLDVAVSAPFKGELLVSTETNEIHSSHWVKVEKPGLVKTKIKIPKVLPNVYLTALLLKNPNENGGKKFIPARAWGAKSLTVKTEEHNLAIKVSAPEIIESRKELQINIENKERVPAEYTVAVVDEGILQMTKFKTPSPSSVIFEARRLGVTSFETLGWTMAYSGQHENTGGDEETRSPQSVSMPVKLVSFWFPLIKSDKTGKAVVNVPLPAFQGKVRVMVVGSGKERFGSADSHVIVRDPLVVQTTLPRFFTKGDSFVFPVALRNFSGKDQEVRLTVDHGAEVNVKKAAFAVKLKNEQEEIIRVKANVVASKGSAKIGIKAEATDGAIKSEESFDIPLKPAGVEQSIYITKQLSPSLNLSNFIPAGWHGENVQVEASLSDLPFLNSLSSLDSLIGHPYGCIEQTTSGTLPLLVMGDLLKWISPSKTEGKDIRAFVDAGIARVISMQNGDGGFAYWPGGWFSDYWGSAYATHMLVEAKKLGFDVPEQVLEQALNYLQQKVRGAGERMLASEAEHGEATSSPFALYVLSKAGRTVGGELRQFAEQFKAIKFNVKNGEAQKGISGIDAENYFLLAATAKLTGDKETLNVLNDQTVYSMKVVGMREARQTYWSPTRSDGLKLTILEDVFPGHEAGQVLAQRISSTLENPRGYHSTQDIGWGVLGLGKWLSHFKKGDRETLKKVSLAINKQSVKRTVTSEGQTVFQWEGQNLSHGEIRASHLPKDAQGWLYVKAKGFVQEPPMTRGALSIERSYLDTLGQSLDSKNIKVGDMVVVHLRIRNKGSREMNNVAIVDRIPAGFEMENPRIRQGASEYSWMGETFTPEFQNLRDDRIQAFGTLKTGSEQDLYYIVRAVTEGKFHAPASFVEAMYEPEEFAYGSNQVISIKSEKTPQ